MTAPKFIVVQGRGRCGKTTLVRVLVERMEAAGRDAFVVDIDRSIASLGAFIHGVNRPPSLDDYSLTDWLHALVNTQVADKSTVVADVGGGDLLFGKVSAEIGLVDLLGSVGVLPISLWVLGPETEALPMLSEAQSSGFWPAASALVLSAALAPPGQPLHVAFAPVRNHPIYRGALAAGAREVVFPRLGCLARVNEREISFGKAAQDATFGLTYSHMVRMWQKACEEALIPIEEWLP